MYAARGQMRGRGGVGAVIDRPLQPSGQCDITGKSHGGVGSPRPRPNGNVKFTVRSVGTATMPPVQPSGQCDITGKPRGRAMLAPTTKGKIAIKFQVPRRGGVTPPYSTTKYRAPAVRRGRGSLSLQAILKKLRSYAGIQRRVAVIAHRVGCAGYGQ